MKACNREARELLDIGTKAAYPLKAFVSAAYLDFRGFVGEKGQKLRLMKSLTWLDLTEILFILNWDPRRLNTYFKRRLAQECLHIEKSNKWKMKGEAKRRLCESCLETRTSVYLLSNQAKSGLTNEPQVVN